MKKSWFAIGVTACALMAGPSFAAETQLPASSLVLTVDMEIVPSELENFKKAIEENSAASIKEPGCREFHVAFLASDPNHVLLYEVYDDEAALKAHAGTEHFKKFDALRSKMVVKSEGKRYKAIALHEKTP